MSTREEGRREEEMCRAGQGFSTEEDLESLYFGSGPFTLLVINEQPILDYFWLGCRSHPSIYTLYIKDVVNHWPR